MLFRFVLYGLLGWGLEILWTGINSVRNGDRTLRGTSSLWMFPIYGMGVLLESIINLLTKLPWAIRGGTYMLCIFIAEYVFGRILKKYSACPWDYSSSAYSIQDVIRLDYAPLWFTVGLVYEWVYKTILINI